MNKKAAVLGLILLSLIVLNVGVVAAQDNMFDPIIDLFRDIGGSLYKFRDFSDAQRVGFFKFMFAVVVFAVIFFGLQAVDFFKENRKATGIIALVIALISMYMLPDSVVQELMVSYTAIVTTFLTLAPVVALMFMHHKIGHETVPQNIFRLIIMALMFYLITRVNTIFQGSFGLVSSLTMIAVIYLFFTDIFHLVGKWQGGEHWTARAGAAMEGPGAQIARAEEKAEKKETVAAEKEAEAELKIVNQLFTDLQNERSSLDPLAEALIKLKKIVDNKLGDPKFMASRTNQKALYDFVSRDFNNIQSFNTALQKQEELLEDHLKLLGNYIILELKQELNVEKIAKDLIQRTRDKLGRELEADELNEINAWKYTIKNINNIYREILSLVNSLKASLNRTISKINTRSLQSAVNGAGLPGISSLLDQLISEVQLSINVDAKLLPLIEKLKKSCTDEIAELKQELYLEEKLEETTI